jgi:hopanoid biosynthesis associated protein HpnK
VRRLIINADDFGLTAGVNRAIIEAHQRGVVTSTTLMASGRAFDDAVQLAASVPTLSVGCHVVLVDGHPILPASEVPTLLDDESSAPQFPARIGQLARRALLGRLDANQVEAENIAQIGRVQSRGIHVSHVDTHKHAHVFPQVIGPLLRAANKCGVHAVRNPFELIRVRTLSRPHLWKRTLQMAVLRPLAKRFRQAVAAAGMITPDGTLGIAATGALDENLFAALAESVPQGTWEFVCHPGYNDSDLQTVATRLRESRDCELRLLTSPGTRELLAAHGIELVSYRDFVQHRP